MKKFVVIGIALLSCLLVWSCSSTVHFTVERESKIKLDSIRVIEVLPFEASGILDVEGTSMDGNLGFVGTINHSIIFSSAPYSRSLSQTHRSLLKEDIDSTQKYVSYFEDRDSIDARLKGKLQFWAKDTSHKVMVEDEKKIRYKRIAQIIVDYELIDSRKTSLGSSRIKRKTIDSVDVNPGDDPPQLRPWETLISVTVKKVIGSTINQITPYKKPFKRELLEGEADLIDLANEEAYNGNWNSALIKWHQFENDSDWSNKLAALHNISIYFERIDSLKQARDYVDQCYKISSNPDYKSRSQQLNRRINAKRSFLQDQY